MKKRVLAIAALVLCAGIAAAQSEDAEFAFFKRTIAPVMRWGENGIITVPKATTLGKANFFLGIMGQPAGTLQGLDLYTTSLSLMAGTSDDVELGYTRRQVVWEDFMLSNLSMDSFHLKARFLNFGDYLLPQAAIGVNVDLSLFNFLYAFAELQGFNPKVDSNEVLNLGAKLRLGFVSLGVALFNISLDTAETDNLIDQYASSLVDLSNANYIATLAFDIRLGKKAQTR
jgi:hypothetical protein